MEAIADYDCIILYKPGKENIVADILSYIHINVLAPVTTRSVINELITGYKAQPFKDLISTVEKGNNETTNRYTIKDKLLYYCTDEYES